MPPGAGRGSRLWWSEHGGRGLKACRCFRPADGPGQSRVGGSSGSGRKGPGVEAEQDRGLRDSSNGQNVWIVSQYLGVQGWALTTPPSHRWTLTSASRAPARTAPAATAWRATITARAPMTWVARTAPCPGSHALAVPANVGVGWGLQRWHTWAGTTEMGAG